jgi:hypothetical protein
VEIDFSVVPARLGISDLFTSDNRNTRSTCPTSVFAGTGQLDMRYCRSLIMLRYSVDEENVGGKEIEARSEA